MASPSTATTTLCPNCQRRPRQQQVSYEEVLAFRYTRTRASRTRFS